MAVSLSEILATLQNGVTALNGLSRQVRSTFPQRSRRHSRATGAVAGALLREAEEPNSFNKPD